jgi:hypothetical protein
LREYADREGFVHDIDFERVALSPGQIRLLSLPRAPDAPFARGRLRVAAHDVWPFRL